MSVQDPQHMSSAVIVIDDDDEEQVGLSLDIRYRAPRPAAYVTRRIDGHALGPCVTIGTPRLCVSFRSSTDSRGSHESMPT